MVASHSDLETFHEVVVCSSSVSVVNILNNHLKRYGGHYKKVGYMLHLDMGYMIGYTRILQVV